MGIELSLRTIPFFGISNEHTKSSRADSTTLESAGRACGISSMRMAGSVRGSVRTDASGAGSIRDVEPTNRSASIGPELPVCSQREDELSDKLRNQNKRNSRNSRSYIVIEDKQDLRALAARSSPCESAELLGIRSGSGVSG